VFRRVIVRSWSNPIAGCFHQLQGMALKNVIPLFPESIALRSIHSGIEALPQISTLKAQLQSLEEALGELSANLDVVDGVIATVNVAPDIRDHLTAKQSIIRASFINAMFEMSRNIKRLASAIQ